jgi:hypothetical protein
MVVEGALGALVGGVSSLHATMARRPIISAQLSFLDSATAALGPVLGAEDLANAESGAGGDDAGAAARPPAAVGGAMALTANADAARKVRHGGLEWPRTWHTVLCG